METKVEYRVRPVTRYIVTKYTQIGNGTDVPIESKVQTLGEYENHDTAYAVGYALCKAEHERLGWPIGDERILYPIEPGLNEPPSHPYPSAEKKQTREEWERSIPGVL